MIGEKYNKWIIILQEFDLKFVSAKLKKSLIFAELIFDFPSLDEEEVYEDTFVDEHVFLISTLDLWYGDIIVPFIYVILKFWQCLGRLLLGTVFDPFLPLKYLSFPS